MTSGRAAILGAVQGLTEFLPVSSDGHLALLQALWGEDSLAMDVALHLGTLLALLLFFRRDIAGLAASVGRRAPDTWGAKGADAAFSRTTDGSRALERRRLGLILLATIPTGIIGLALKGVVERLTASLAAAGIGFLLTAAALLAGERRGRRTTAGLTAADAPLWHALLIGLAQGAAVWPGLSRSASTIAVALALGWRWEEAGRFSFLAAVPAILGAAILTSRDMASLPVAPAAVGFLTAFLVGALALSLLMRFLAARRLWPFALYCLGLGLFSLFKSV